MISKVNNVRAWHKKEIELAEQENVHWTMIEEWAAGRKVAETQANEYRLVMSR
jgi:hypothetical protein